jgi:hypothetical protein
MLKKSIENKFYIESHTLSWSTIEQLLLPRLISWLAEIHKLPLPKDAYKMNAQNINIFYLVLSHDIDLFKKLEKARYGRNKIIHKLSKLGDITAINQIAKDLTKENLELQEEIMKRFNGDALIPSINLYRDGWNDALSDFQLKILKIKEEIRSIQALHNEKQK